MISSFKLGTCTVPDGESGPWKIDTFTVSKEEARFESARAIFSGNPIMRVSPGTYKRLTCKGRGVVMSNTQMEVSTNYEAFRNSKGRVLINGLGLGMLLEAILSKPEVTYVRVIEKEQDVINLVAPHFASDPRVEIIHADAYEYIPAKGERFDYCWHDIWDEICYDNLGLMAKLGRRYGKRRSDGQGFWSRDLIRSNVRRWA